MRTDRTPAPLLRAVVLTVAMLWAMGPVAQAVHHVHHDHAIAGDTVVHVDCDHAASAPELADASDDADDAAPRLVDADTAELSASACAVTPIPAGDTTGPDVRLQVRLLALPTLAPRPPPSQVDTTRDQWRLPPATGPPIEPARA